MADKPKFAFPRRRREERGQPEERTHLGPPAPKTRIASATLAKAADRPQACFRVKYKATFALLAKATIRIQCAPAAPRLIRVAPGLVWAPARKIHFAPTLQITQHALATARHMPVAPGVGPALASALFRRVAPGRGQAPARLQAIVSATSRPHGAAISGDARDVPTRVAPACPARPGAARAMWSAPSARLHPRRWLR